MQGTTIIVFITTIAVASASFCSSPESLGLDDRENTPIKSKPKLQVLTLQSPFGIDRRLIEERKFGMNLDGSFISIYGGEVQAFLVHRSVMVKYSPIVRDYFKMFADKGILKNNYELKYPADIVESIVGLIYERRITIKKSDYRKTIACAKDLGFDKWIKAIDIISTPDNATPGFPFHIKSKYNVRLT